MKLLAALVGWFCVWAFCAFAIVGDDEETEQYATTDVTPPARERSA